MSLRLCVAGATGWTGSAVTRAILEAPDLVLAGAVARQSAGQDIGSVLGRAPAGIPVAGDIAGGLAAGCDVLIDYSSSTVAKANALAAIAAGVAVVIGTSGLTAEDFAEIGEAADAGGIGVIASGNFSVTAALLQHFALIAARFLDKFELVDYAGHAKLDAPSGTARELAEKLGDVTRPKLGRALDDINGPPGIRGATVNGVQVHSVRLPGYVLGVEAIFGEASERLTLRHDAGESAAPYVAGTLIAAKAVVARKGLLRGFDNLLMAP